MKTQYSMVGVFIQPFYGNGIFEGKNLLHNETDNSLIGKLSDVAGQSSIKGTLELSKGVMEFEQQYYGDKSIIEYKFVKQENLWRGNFNGEWTGLGEAMCEIFNPKKQCSQFDWNYIASKVGLSDSGTENLFQDLLKRMAHK